MVELPPVSCVCLTYGRTHVLEEAIESFLRQDYKGKKELLVLNDYSEQTLHFEHPEVVIVNTCKRFKTVGEKRNASVALASHDIIFVWDDDDIFLPWRISYSIGKFDESRGFFKPSKAFVLNDGQISGPKSNLFHSGSCWSRELFDAVRGYKHMGSGQDFEIEKKFDVVIGGGKNYNEIKPEEIYYIYRWGGTGTFHLSGFGKDKDGEKSGNDKVEEFIKKKKESGKLKDGDVLLKPVWKEDYVVKVMNFIKDNKRIL